jgi:hypothetical protein
MSSVDNRSKPSRHKAGGKGGRGEPPDQQQQQQEQQCKAISGAICTDGGLLFCHVCKGMLQSCLLFLLPFDSKVFAAAITAASLSSTNSVICMLAVATIGLGQRCPAWSAFVCIHGCAMVCAGSQLEGGGQILRNAVALSALTGNSIHVDKIRAGAHLKQTV